MSTLGIDVGTSAVKAVRFDAGGHAVAAARAPLPAPLLCGDEATQPLAAIERAVDSVVRELTADAPPDLVALTTQRDTALLLDERGVPSSPLISWRDRRHLRHGSLWALLDLAGARRVRVRSLASHLVERWTGRAAETEATRTRHLSGPALDALRARDVDVDVPDIIPVGARVGAARPGCALPAGTDVHLTAGDKNAELLGAGVERPGAAGLSIGTAISLGIAVCGDRPAAVSGTVVTRAALEGTWNVETGLVAGTGVVDRMRARAGAGPVPDDAWRPDLWCVPLPAGGLDGEPATGLLAGLREDTRPADLVRAWAQGVACELAHLMPLLVSGRSPIGELRVYGGGSDAAWCSLLADVTGLPTRTVDGACGARGAVLCVRLHMGDGAAAAALRSGIRLSAVHEPASGRQGVARYRERYARLRTAAVPA